MARLQQLSVLLACYCLCMGFEAVRAVPIEGVSFKPPFEKLDNAGNRIVNDTWSHGGSADVKKHFIRLTTDRQSKRGFVWQKKQVEADTFSAVLTFRISGVGKRWFGDGIGLWFTEHKNFYQGINHGFTDKFKGVGIVIDTYNNPEHRGGHKDISVQVNDGSKTFQEMMDEARVGCDANVRYHEESAAFDPAHSQSRVKVKIEGQRLVVEVDAEGRGYWTACTELTLPFPSDWLRTKTIGITGATGALADNHDVLRFDAFTDFQDVAVQAADSEALLHAVSKDYKKWLDSPNCGADCLIAVLTKELSNFKISAEHRFADLKEKTENTVGKLRSQEQKNEARVKEIETKVARLIDSTIDYTNQNFNQEVKSKLEQTLEKNPELAGGGGWKFPFFVFALVVGVGCFLAYRKYQALMKSHLL